MPSLCRKGTSFDLIFLHKKKHLNNHNVNALIKFLFVHNDDIICSLVVT